ncbi:MAG: FAD-dependent oxidoreductase [Thermoleophilaceae bacterium]
MSDSPDVVVIGAGAIGLSVAWRCAQRGLSVHVLDRGDLGSGATGASAGILSPTEPREWTGVLGAFNLPALEAWPAFATELEQESGIPAGYESRGELRLLRNGSDATFVDAAETGAHAFGLAHERLTESDLVVLEPGLARGSTALLLTGAAAVNTSELAEALRVACTRAGVQLSGAAEVVSLESVPGTVSARLRDGRTVQAGHAVVSAGAWSSTLLGEHAPPVSPVLGESVVLDMGTSPPCRLVVRSTDGAVVPRRDGTLWMGTTLEERGFVSAPRAGAVRDIIVNATAFLPAIAELEFVRAQAGLRPGTPDGLPIVGPSDLAGVAMATGHGREGIMHAPLTADLVAQALEGGRWARALAPFAPSRFPPPGAAATA